MIKKVGHIGIFVKSIEETIDALSKFMDFDKPEIKESEAMGMKASVVNLAGFELELIQDMNDEGHLAKFVKEKGDMIHHFCLETDDIDADIANLKEKGIEMADQTPRIGIRGKRIAMTSPAALNGVTIELSEP